MMPLFWPLRIINSESWICANTPMEMAFYTMSKGLLKMPMGDYSKRWVRAYMKLEYLDYLNRMNRFNEWKERFCSQFTVAEKLNQFLVLYGLWDFVPENIRQKVHDEHVEALCRTQKRLMTAKSNITT